MAHIVDFFTKQRVQIADTPTQVAKVSGVVTYSDLEASKHFNFRKDWAYTLKEHKKVGIPLETILQHRVTLADLGKAISIAAILKDDKVAVEYFLGLSTQMTANKQFHMPLSAISNPFKGYVWALDFQKIINAAAFAEYQLASIIGEPVTRHIFF